MFKWNRIKKCRNPSKNSFLDISTFEGYECLAVKTGKMATEASFHYAL